MPRPESQGDRNSGGGYSWWGPGNVVPRPLSVVELIDGGSLDARISAFLEQRASIVVAAPSGAGKTTMLTALLGFLPADVETIYLQGWYERFSFLDQRDPTATYLLCNEISNHLPTYLWGCGVRQLFETMRLGYGMAATIHGESACDVLGRLAAYPLDVPPDLLTALDLVLTLTVRPGRDGPIRRVTTLEVIHDANGEPRPETIATREVLLGPLVSRPGRLVGLLSTRFGIDPALAPHELARREQFLERLRRDDVTSIAAVNSAIKSYSVEDR
jgi:hypothetical protein